MYYSKRHQERVQRRHRRELGRNLAALALGLFIAAIVFSIVKN